MSPIWWVFQNEIQFIVKMKSKVDRLLERALSFQGSGRLKKAVESFQEILTIDPNQPDALYHLGGMAHGNGQFEMAIQLLVKSLQTNSNNVLALNALAGVLKDQQRFPEAMEFYQAALAISPNEAYLHSNLGLVLNEMQRHDEAMICYQRALELNPKWHVAHSNMGVIFQNRGEWKKALECYERTLAVNSKSSVALTNTGSILNEQGRYSEAVKYHVAALKNAPDSDLIHNNLGVALQKMGRLQESIDSYQRALKYNPKSYLALRNLGSAFWELHQADSAVGCLRKALEIKPDCFMTWNSLGAVLKEQGFVVEGIACFHKALEFQPDAAIVPQIYRNLGGGYFAEGRSEESVAWFRKALELIPDSAATFSDLLLVLNHLQLSPEAVLAEHLQFGEKFNSLREPIPFSNSLDRERRLRVGFVSADLRHHAVAYFIEPVFTTYPKSQFEIFCYSNFPKDDAVSERLKAKVDSWCNVASLSDDELSARIRKDEIDILVDLSGHTARNRLPVFARKPAPIQVSMIGYMQTTGLAAMDYRITDELLDPIGISDHLSTEKLIRLSAGGSPFQAPQNCPEVNELPAIKNGYVTFASFNKLSKITPEVFETWARLLKAVPNSRLMVASVTCDLVARTMAAHGIEADRLELHQPMPMKDYLELHHRVDFYLDTFPYTGGTTSLIAAWMGIPFISLEGSTTISRSGAGVLKIVGLNELIATDPDDYVRKAVEAVQDLSRLAEWRGVMRSRLAAYAGDGSIFTKELGIEFRKMWSDWCDHALKGEG